MIADGTSAFTFFHDLLQAYAAIRANRVTEDVTLSALSAHSVCFPSGVSTTDQLLLSALMPVLKYQLWEHPRLPWQKVADKRRTVPLFASGSAPKFQILKQACRDRNLTVGNFLNAAVAFVLSHQFVLNGLPLNGSVPVHCAANLRNRLTPPRPAGDLCCLFAPYTVKVDVQPNVHFWRMAQQGSISQKKELENILLSVPAFDRLVSADERGYWAKVPCGRLGDLTISNIGVFPFDTEPMGPQQPKIREIYICNNLNELGTLHTVFVTCIESLQFTWVYDHYLVDRAVAEKMLADLIHLCENPPEENFSFSDFVTSPRQK